MSFSTPSTHIESIYNFHYSNCWTILRDSGVSLSAEHSLELHAMLYVLADFACFVSKQDRSHVSNVILSVAFRHLSSIYPTRPVNDFRNRINFYTSVIGDLQLHAHALMGEDVSDSHPVVRCAIAFSDCCLYPAYIKDYASPSPMLDALQVFEFSSSGLQPLTEELASFHNEIYGLKSTPVQEPISRPTANSSSIQMISNTPAKKSISDSNKIIIALSIVIILLLTAILGFLITNGNNSGLLEAPPTAPQVNSTEPTLIHTEPAKGVNRPRNGQILTYPRTKRVAPLTIETYGSLDFYFVLEPIVDENCKMSFYVHGGQTVDLDVPCGKYRIYYATGTTWYGTNQLFGDGTHCTELKSIFEFEETADGYNGWTIELEPVYDGNLDSDTIPMDKFPK